MEDSIEVMTLLCLLCLYLLFVHHHGCCFEVLYETHLVNPCKWKRDVLGTEPPDCQRSGQMQAAIQCGMLRRKPLSQRRWF